MGVPDVLGLCLKLLIVVVTMRCAISLTDAARVAPLAGASCAIPEAAQGRLAVLRGAQPFSIRHRMKQGYPLNLSISLSGGEETNQDAPSNGE